MENCSLGFKTPQKNSSMVNLNIDGGNAMLDIWQLSSDKPLTGKVSWDSKPPRNQLVATTNLSYGMDIALFNFRCIPGSFHTFEVACHGASCHIDGTWSKDGREQYHFIFIEYPYWNPWYLAFYILQSQTLGIAGFESNQQSVWLKVTCGRKLFFVIFKFLYIENRYYL